MIAARRAFIRGVGAVSSVGGTWPATASALAAGAVGVAPITRFDVDGFPCRVAAVIADELLAAGVDRGSAGPGTPTAVDRGESESAGGRVPRRIDAAGEGDRRVLLAQHAVAEAWAMAATGGLEVPAERVGVFIGAASGLSCFAAAVDLSRAAGGGQRFDEVRFARDDAAVGWVDPRRTAPTAVAWAVARALGARGPSRTLSLACASGAAAIVEGVRAIRAGTCDVAVCAGVGADIDPLMLAAFGRLGALSARGRSAPFDVGRDGFVLGEGAAALVLAAERGSAAAEVAGVGRTLDGHHVTAPDPTGQGARRAIAVALSDAGAPRIGYVQAHGTSTPAGDAVEAASLRAALGDVIDDAAVASAKGALGHWLAGAGALGAACAWHAVVSGELLPTAGLEVPGADCVLPHVIGRASYRDIDAALVNSFGFGGANACLVVRRVA